MKLKAINKFLTKHLLRFLDALDLQNKKGLADHTRDLKAPPDEELLAFNCSLLPSTQARKQPG